MAYDEKCCFDCEYYESDDNSYPCNKCYNGVVNAIEGVNPMLFKPKAGVKSNSVEHPTHYNQGGIECIDAMIAAYGKEAVENFCLVNAFKYVWRTQDKNGLEDIDKAIWYLNKYKELVDSE